MRGMEKIGIWGEQGGQERRGEWGGGAYTWGKKGERETPTPKRAWIPARAWGKRGAMVFVLFRVDDL
eukprot:6214529-Pleurochrysis_carterae.AAC.4